jgi:plasmid maintenance system antidote protein VapI
MKKGKEPSNTNQHLDGPYADFDSFEELFDQARQRLDYRVEGAKNEFTEKTVRRMQALGVTRTELAERLGKKQSHITKLLGGSNNFTIETMVQISEALECHFRCHLEPANCQTHWVDMIRPQALVVKNEQEEATAISNTDATFASAA